MNPSNQPPSSSLKRSAVLTEFEKAIASRLPDYETRCKVVNAVERWTNGQPTLTRILCDCLLDCTSQIDNELDPQIVDAVVQRQIVDHWSSNAAAAHLNKIAEAILSYDVRDALMILYLKILQRGVIAPNDSPEQEVLLRSGLVSMSDGQLRVANPIYAKIFNLTWIELQLPGLTRPVSIVSKNSRSQSAVRSKPLSRRLPALVGLLAMAAASALFVRACTESPAVTLNSASSAEMTQPDELPAAANAEETTQLTLLADTFSGYSTFRNADFQATLQEVGIDINYSNEFDQSLRAEQLSSGDADLIVTTLDQFLQQQPEGRIIGLIDRTIGADAVVLNTKRYPALKSLLDLETLVAESLAEGQALSIAYAEDTPSEYLAMVLDAKFDNFDLSDFELRPVADASEAWALMQNPEDNIAIAVLWEPFVTQARQQGYNVVLSSDDAPTAIVDVLVASEQILDANPTVLSQLLETYYRRIDANARDATQLQTQVANDGDLAVSDAVAIINGIDFFTAIEAETWMNDGILDTRINATAAVLNLANELETLPSAPQSLYTSQLVVKAANNTQTLIDLVRADNPALADKLAGVGNLGADTENTPVVSVAQIQQAPDIGTLRTSGQVGFDTGSAQLTEEGIKTLSQVAAELKEFNGQNVAVRIIGHTSRTGDAAANQKLSQARTTVVVDQLKEMGVTLNFLPEGKGFSEPLPGIDPTDRQQQRTEIRLVRVN
ncbi:MAG: OmpA family protein [Phormidesmis sp.]